MVELLYRRPVIMQLFCCGFKGMDHMLKVATYTPFRHRHTDWAALCTIIMSAPCKWSGLPYGPQYSLAVHKVALYCCAGLLCRSHKPSLTNLYLTLQNFMKSIVIWAFSNPIRNIANYSIIHQFFNVPFLQIRVNLVRILQMHQYITNISLAEPLHFHVINIFNGAQF